MKKNTINEYTENTPLPANILSHVIIKDKDITENQVKKALKLLDKKRKRIYEKNKKQSKCLNEHIVRHKL